MIMLTPICDFISGTTIIRKQETTDLNPIKAAFVPVFAAAGMIVNSAVHAQYDYNPYGRYKSVEEGGRSQFGSVSLYPFTPFFTSGRFADGSAGNLSQTTVLVAGDVGTRLGHKQSTLEFGGWNWFRAGDSVYQLHTRLFLTRDLGVQVGYVGKSGTGGSAISTFLLYDLTAGQRITRTLHTWAVEFGVGTFTDNSGGKSTTDASLLLQASFYLGRRFSLNATGWYV